MRLYLLVILAILLSLRGNSQHELMRFRRLATSDGLSQKTVLCIHQDDIGYMWFGTIDGLNRFDGYEFKIFYPDPDNEYSIGNTVINHISKKSEDELWICTEEGMYIYKQKHNEFHLFPHLKEEGIRCILKDYDHNLWIGTYSGLHRYIPSEERLVSYYHDRKSDSSISSNNIRCLLKDSHNNLWIGTDNGLNLYNRNNNAFLRYQHSADPFSIIGDDIWSMIEDNDGRLWIGVAQAGLDIFTNSKEIPVKGNFSHVMNGSPSKIFIDSVNRLWIGMGGGKGMYIIDLDDFDPLQKVRAFHYTHSINYNESLSDNSILSFYEDTYGDMWIGSFGGGVNYYSERTKKFNNVSVSSDKNTSISANLVNSFYEEADYLWIGTELGLDRLNKRTGIMDHFYHDPVDPESIGANAIYSIMKDSRGNLWIGSWNGGLSLFNYKTGKFKNFKPENKPGEVKWGNVFSIYEDSYGNLWIGSIYGGLSRYDYGTGNLTHYIHDDNDPASLYNNSVQQVFQSRSGKLYICVYQSLDLYDYENDNFIHFTHDDKDSTSISKGKILSVFEDSKNNIWIATNMGLHFMDENKKEFRNFNTSHGLPNNAIQGILEDNHGNLWISTNKGIAVFFNAVNKPHTPEFRLYDSYDGLSGNQFIPRSAYKNESGKMYFGTTQGYTSFYPDSIVDNMKSPLIIFTDFSLLQTGKNEKINEILTTDINYAEEINLSHRQSDFVIKYAALNYVDSKKNKYKYRLDGYEKGWHQTGNQRSATYTNIQHGKYTFMVMGSNNDGIWCKEPKVLRIIINPPWWKTIAARIAFILLIIVFFVVLYRIRFNLLEQQKKLLEKTVKERTNDLLALNKVLEENQNKIAKQNKELEKHRNNLEMLIKERTAELEKAKIKAEESDNLKSAFLANMSHEIRTPMNAIIGYTILLNDKNLSDDQRQRYTEIISSSSESLLVLIDDIIDISLIEGNQLVLYKNEFSADKILEELENYYRLNNSKGLDILFVRNNEGKNLVINNDAVRFRQILNNLINNAVKYTESGSISFGYRILDKKAQFFVSDTGVGIDPEDQKNIFNHFFKVEKEHSKIYRGTGIGLAICKRLCDLMGGEIWVESNKNKGSVFYFTLPSGI